LVPISLAVAGCSLVGRITIMPTVDTHGGVGAEAKLTGAIGLTTKVDHAKSESSTIGLLDVPASIVGAVGEKEGSPGELGFDVGFEYAQVGRDPGNVGFRGGALFSQRVRVTGSVPPLLGATLSTAMPFVLSRSGESRLALGPCIDAMTLGEGDYARSQIGAGISLDWYDLTEWTVR
jgi:hypothetical protein